MPRTLRNSRMRVGVLMAVQGRREACSGAARDARDQRERPADVVHARDDERRQESDRARVTSRNHARATFSNAPAAMTDIATDETVRPFGDRTVAEEPEYPPRSSARPPRESWRSAATTTTAVCEN